MVDKLFNLSVSSEPEGSQALSFRVEEGVAIVSLGDGGDGVDPWGTKQMEHRLNPMSLKKLFDAIDAAERDPEVSALVCTAEGKFFSNGFDLKWIQGNMDKADMLQQGTEALCARLLKFTKPTICAANGHATAAGAMLALSFDVVVMNSERGYCFVPGVDLGLVYSPGMTAPPPRPREDARNVRG